MEAERGAEQVRVVARDVASTEPLLRTLGIPREPDPSESAFVLVERDGRLDLRPPGESSSMGVRSTFPPDRRPTGRARNPLVRAFGRGLETIFDLTAGFGADAYRLAEAGYRVVACERHPAVYAVLASGWAQDRSSGRVPVDVAERLSFRHAEGMDMLAAIDRPGLGVYLDPMYPRPGRVRALPRRELQVLRSLQPVEVDAGPLLAAARRRAARVVVKRPHRAPPLAPDVSFDLGSKLVRFDVYVNVTRSGHADRCDEDSDPAPVVEASS